MRISGKGAKHVAAAKAAILDLLKREHAVTAQELEAKLVSSKLHADIHPHIISFALRELTYREVTADTSPSKGTSVTTYVLRGTEGTRAVVDARKRKRALTSFFRSMARVSGKSPNVIGRGGEEALGRALAASGPLGFMAVGAVGKVSELNGVPVRPGPLDGAANTLLGPGKPRTGPPVAFEVKNIRHWLYPNDSELGQVLVKASNLVSDLQEPVLPVIVCPRAHFWTFRLAKDHGLFVIPTQDQFYWPHAEFPEERIEELRSELGFRLVKSDGSVILDRMKGPLRDGLEERAARFATVSRLLKNDYEAHWAAHSDEQRSRLLEDMLRKLRAANIECVEGWTRPLREDYEDDYDDEEGEEDVYTDPLA